MSNGAWLDVAMVCGGGSLLFLWLAGWLLSESLRPPKVEPDPVEESPGPG